MMDINSTAWSSAHSAASLCLPLPLSSFPFFLLKLHQAPRLAENTGVMKQWHAAGSAGSQPTLPPPRLPRSRPRGARGRESVLVRPWRHRRPSAELGTEQALDAAHSLLPACPPGFPLCHPASRDSPFTGKDSKSLLSAKVLPGSAISLSPPAPVLSSKKLTIITHNKGLPVYDP